MVDQSAQSCIVTPLNPITLTATGEALVNGTVNVTIQCVCPVFGSQRVRWYDINTNFVFRSVSPNYVDGSPYYIRNAVNGLDDNVTLVIPTFNDSYDGTYSCGIRVNNTSFTSPNAAVTLTIGELMINIVSYLFVVTLSHWCYSNVHGTYVWTMNNGIFVGLH